MTMDLVPSHLVVQFSEIMHIKAQQMRSRFRPYVVLRRMTGDTYAYDGLGTVEAREVVARFSPTVWDDIEFFRRKIAKRRFVITLPVDKLDLEGMLTDPQGQMAQAAVMGMERVYDQVVMQAMFATVFTGQSFATSLSFSAGGGLTVDATAGLTLPKILTIKQNFIDQEVGNEGSNTGPADIVVGISGEEHTTLMQIDQFINSRYTNQFALEKGVLVRVAGMDLIPFGASITTPVLAVSGGVRTCFALAREGMCVGIGREWEVTVKDRPDYVDTKQIQITGVLGAVRTEEKRVQELLTTV